MSFINKYDKAPHSYWNSKKRGNIIYSVGAIQVSTNGYANNEGINFASRESFDERSAKRMALSEVSVEALITKVDSNGVLIWEKRYKSNNVDKIYFDDLVFCDNNDIIVLGVHDNNEGFSLLRFDEDGNEVWYKFMPPTTNQEGIQGLSVPKILKTGLEEYLVQVDEQFYIDSVLQPENYLYKFDGNGSLILQRRLSSDVGKFSINGITLNNSNNNIALCGSNIKSSVGSIVFSGILIELDQSFDIVSRYTMKTGQNSTEYLSLHDVYATGQYYIVSGVMNDSERYNFLAKIIPPVNAEINQTVKVIFSQWFSKCFFNSNFIYLQKNDREDTYITKLNHNLDVLWNKNFDSGNYNYRAIRQVTSSNIILSNYFIASLNLDLNSCLTTEVEALQYSDKTFWLTPKLDFKVVKPTHALKDYDILDVVVDSKKKEICPTIIDDDVPTVKDNTLLQSPNFYLQSAGSVGQDSTKGIHLRWIFAGVLGEKHLPKGDYANTNFNFNKPNDFVKIYRAPYVKETFILSFAEVPQTVNDSQKFWLYKFNNDTRIFFVYFRNSAKYNLVRSSIDPMVDPMAFVQSYGNELIEIENKRELFFASDISVANISASSSMQLESLSVPENKIFVPKSLSYRKTLDSSELADARVVCENGRSIRYKTQNCVVTKLSFEFYSDFISATSLSNSWTVMGSYALTNLDSEAFTRLDPLENDKPVNGAWLRFNDDAYVNTDNYKDRWNGPVESWDRNIKDVVNQYITLSDEANNPRAIQVININLANENDIVTVEEDVPVGETPEGGMEVSNLDLLRVASYDYHIARMLGLGTLDLDDLIFDGEFIYLGEYYTFGDLEDGSDGEVHHLSMALPTSLMTQRLPLAVDLKELVPGMYVEDDTTEPNNICDENGYSFDGKKRYISIYAEELLEGEQNPTFFANSDSIDTSTFTLPVYAGLEYKKILIGGADPGIWEKPELSHKLQYLNIDATSSESYETVPLFLPDEGSPIYLHRQTQSGTHFYSSYGINWFSRATSSEIILDIFTEIKPFNTLLPPANLNPFLIRRENPLMFTSLLEQDRYSDIDDNDDKTLVRLLFDYNSDQELINYQIPLDSNLPDSFYETDPDSIFRDAEEIFGDEIEIYFRDKTPRQISAQLIDQNQEPIIQNITVNILADIKTKSYFQASTGTTLLSEFPQGTTAQNFVGGIFLMGEQQYIIHSINPGVDGLIFTVYKKQISDGMLSNEIPPIDAQNLQMPYYEGEGLFTVVENMQNVESWGVASNPHNFKVVIGTDDWEIHREVVRVQNDNGLQDRYLEKTRGFWEPATVEKYLENFTFQNSSGAIINKIQTHRGIYKITFNSFQLANHIHTNAVGNSVEWFNGSVRLFTESNMVSGSLQDSRKVFTVFKTENIGSDSSNLVLYINDPNFVADANGDPVAANDDILIGTNVLTNYYPSYRVYLNHSIAHNLTEEHTLPSEGEVVRYTIFGLRTVDYNYTNVDGTFYKSRFCAPKLMFANELIGAEVPEQPLGGLYATRPDFFGKSTYTFTTKYTHKPHGVSFYRSDNQAMLSALYKVETIKSIFESLKELGGNDEEYFTNRWNNFTNFTELESIGDYTLFPPTLVSPDNYKFPLPNKKQFFEDINNFILYHNQTYNDTILPIQEAQYGNLSLNHPIIPLVSGQNDELKLIDFVKEAVLNTFIPLTEVPIIYKFIHTEADYKPTNKKQNIRDRDGYLIDPNTNNPEFEMAPMMKVIGTSPHETQFTDFTLDGTSSNVYFYAVKEISSQMKMGEFSPFLGPIKLVNTNPPEEPKIKSALPVLENRVLGITPHIKFEVAAYPQVQNIKKINLYRTTNRLAAESVQSMDLIKIIEIDNEFSVDDSIWTFTDDFSNSDDVPYSETLFYRITVSRKVVYADKNQDVIVEFAPSQPSRILATMVVETYSPESPILNYTAGEYNPITGTSLEYITLNWEQNVYKGNYHIYKMNSQGNWIEIIRVVSDRITKGLYHFYNQDAQGNWVNTIHPEPLNTFNNMIYLPLELTNLATTSLATKTIDGKPIYHHLKVISQNTAGMFSKKENILTLYNAASYTSDFGIGSNTGDDGMVIQGNFVVRHN